MAKSVAYRFTIILFAGLWTAASSASAQTTGKSWVLEKGLGVAPVKDRPASLTVDAKQMTGSTGCNTFSATIADRPDKRVAIGDVALTRKLCAPQANNNERAIVLAFSKTEFVEQGPDTLTFLSGKREPLLVWKTTDKAAAPERSIRAGMLPPLVGGKNRTVAVPAERATKVKPTRHERAARATKASHKRVVRKHAKRLRVAQRSRRCPWWN